MHECMRALFTFFQSIIIPFHFVIIILILLQCVRACLNFSSCMKHVTILRYILIHDVFKNYKIFFTDIKFDLF